MNCGARAGCSREDLGKTVASVICLISEMLNLEPNKRGSSPTDFIKRNKTGPARSLETQKGRKKVSKITTMFVAMNQSKGNIFSAP
jgi:hypothetical protein